MRTSGSTSLRRSFRAICFAFPHAEVRYSSRVVGLTQDASGVALTVETPQGREEMRADWVVGTDGARSAVRHLLELPFEGHTWPERFVATNLYYDFEQYGFEPANMIADPVNWAVVARLGRENMWRVTYSESAELPEASAASRIPQHYAAILPDPKAPYEIVASSPTECTNAAHLVFELDAYCWPATPRTPAIPAAEWASPAA